MELAVLVEPAAGGRWVARTGPPWGLTADGATAAEAVAGVRADVARRVAAGAVVTSVPVPGGADPLARLRALGVVYDPPTPGTNPWREIAGTLDPDDPAVREWEALIEQNRREMDADPNR